MRKVVRSIKSLLVMVGRSTGSVFGSWVKPKGKRKGTVV